MFIYVRFICLDPASPCTSPNMSCGAMAYHSGCIALELCASCLWVSEDFTSKAVRGVVVHLTATSLGRSALHVCQGCSAPGYMSGLPRMPGDTSKYGQDGPWRRSLVEKPAPIQEWKVWQHVAHCANLSLIGVEYRGPNSWERASRGVETLLIMQTPLKRRNAFEGCA